MRSIYNRAVQVLIWLGLGNEKTDALMTGAKQLQDRGLERGTDCKTIGKVWMESRQNPQSDEGPVPNEWRHRGNDMRIGLYQLLGRSWFRRVWVLQEVASARAALFVCGLKHVSANVFTILASLLRVHPGLHSQAVFDIINSGLLSADQRQHIQLDLYTLLIKFIKCEASDPRDRVFALLGISRDANDSEMLFADYTKDLREVIAITTKFLLSSAMDLEISADDVPNWTISEFFSQIQSLPD